MRRPIAFSGFTLIELLVTLSVLAICATIAVPSFTQFIRNNQVQSASDELYGLLLYARSEAATRGVTVSIDAPAANRWNDDLVVRTFGDVLRQLGATGLSAGNVTVKGNAASFGFQSSGALAAGGNGCLTVCHADAADIRCRYIGIRASGQVLPPNTEKPETGECGA
ncbi:hypothetical protein D9M71_156400 [compost metagenome]